MKPVWVVCVKQVPREPVFRREGEFFQIDRERTEGILNPHDRIALDLAAEIRARKGGRIVALSMGPPRTESALREALAAGADEAILLSDPAFAGADTLATAYTLAAGIRKIGDFSLVLCGARTTDSDTSQVGPQLAEFLDLPMASQVEKLEVRKSEVRLERVLDGVRERLAMRVPALVTVLRRKQEPIPLSLRALEQSFADRPVSRWGLGDLDIDPARAGWEGSGTRARDYAYWNRSRSCDRFDGKTGEAVERILAVLAERNLLGR
ncbi:MAG: electron transfer flavoprotein subunit beta/FixA family protein [bacterium]